MKSLYQKIISLCSYMIILFWMSGFDVNSLFDMRSICMVVIGTMLLTIGSYKRGMKMHLLVDYAKRNAMLSAFLSTFLFIYSLLYHNEEVASIMKEISLSCRPILYGLLIYIICSQWQEFHSEEESKAYEEQEPDHFFSNEEILEENIKVNQTIEQIASTTSSSIPIDLLQYLKEAGLTERETEIVICILEGLTNRKIGEKLYISEATVKKHTNNLYKKLQINNREELKLSISECYVRSTK